MTTGLNVAAPFPLPLGQRLAARLKGLAGNTQEGTGSGLGIKDPIASARDCSDLVRTWPVSQKEGITQRQPVCSHEYMGPGLPVCFFQEPINLLFKK